MDVPKGVYHRACYQKYMHKHQLEKQLEKGRLGEMQEGKTRPGGELNLMTKHRRLNNLRGNPPLRRLIMTTPKTFPECVHVARW